LEGLCAGHDPLRKLRQLQQPRWSPPSLVWILVGIFWYAVCFAVLVRLLPTYREHSGSVWLLIVVMTANAGANIPQFRLRRLDIAFFYLFPYWGILGAFIWSIRHDRVALLLFGIYSAYQGYAAAWEWALWQMNKPPR
jgi:tryptophan-rich sensory protein